MLAAFEGNGKSAEELGKELGDAGVGLGKLKEMVGEAVSEGLRETRGRFERVMAEEGYLDEVAKRGAKKARESAEETMIHVREAVGL